MRMHRAGSPLVLDDIAVPAPAAGELLIRITACGVCRTDLHIVDGDLPGHRLPLVPGYEIVRIVAEAAEGFATGTRVGVPWLGRTCGECSYCRAGQENLCDRRQFTGYDRHGGYAEYCVALAANSVWLPPGDDAHIAPLLWDAR